MRRLKAYLPLLVLIWMVQTALAQDLTSFEKRVQVRTLPNGLTVILLRRPEAPVFSFFSVVDAGDAQDPEGKTGLAHMMEHMAFKGTDNIGTTNITAEKAALAKVETIYAEYDRENHRVVNRDEKKIAELKAEWEKARADADQYVVKNEFAKLIERNGGVGLNASTGLDSTQYFYSLPANRLELWAFLESERFLHPVMREFYKERDVVMEERRMRTDSSPTGRLVEQFLSVAYDGSPYHRPGIGYTSDLRHFSATDAAGFFKNYYVPSNMVRRRGGRPGTGADVRGGGEILWAHSRSPQAGRVRDDADASRTPSAEWCSRTHRNPSILRATRSQTTATRTTWCIR